MKEVKLDVESREISTKHNLKELRHKGLVPAIFYGQDETTVPIAVNAKKFDELLHTSGANVLVAIKVGSSNKTAIIKEVQRDIISRAPIHIDFLAVSMTKKIEVSVPIHITGTAPGVKLSGGVLEHILREIRVKCLPKDIPQSLNVDVSALEIGHSLAVKDLANLEGVEYLADAGSIIVNIVSPTILEEAPAPGTEAAAAAGAAGTAEPEVISKGKKDKEEGAEGAAPAGDKKADAGKAGPAKAPEKK